MRLDIITIDSSMAADENVLFFIKKAYQHLICYIIEIQRLGQSSLFIVGTICHNNIKKQCIFNVLDLREQNDFSQKYLMFLFI